MKKKTKKVDFNDTENIIKVLNNKKTTIEDVLSRLQDLIEEFEHLKEDYYIEKLRIQLEKQNSNTPDEDNLNRLAEKIQKLVVNDTKKFVNTYVKTMNDNILDAINEKKVQKDPAHAFLMLLQTMQLAYEKANTKK
jgi:hypothetical protein